MRGASWRTGLVVAGLVAAVAITFANALSNGFVLDDFHLIVHAPGVRSFADLFSYGTGYRPLRTLSYGLDYAIGDMNPWIFHLSNVVYHAIATLLVFATVRACGAPLAAAGFGAMLFAVHPVQADAVTYASGRRDVLCGLFFAAGLLAYLRYRRLGGSARLVAAAAAFVLALLTKEMAITLPLLCWLYDRWQKSGALAVPRRPRWPYVAGVALAVVAVGAVYGPYIVQRWDKVPWHGGSPGTNFATVARVWVHYLKLLAWPVTLSADYGYGGFALSTSAFDPRALACVGLLALLALAIRQSWRAGGLIGLGGAWYAAALLPVSHIVPHHELLAEHYLYIPMIGVAVAAAGLVNALADRFPERRRVLAAAAAILLVAAATRTVVRNRDWRDDLTIASATVAATPGSGRALVQLGHAYRKRDRVPEAERAFLAAERISPDYLEVHTALAMLYAYLQKDDLVREHLETALRLTPRRGHTLVLAGWITVERDPERALIYFEEALSHRDGGEAQAGVRRARQILAERGRRPSESAKPH